MYVNFVGHSSFRQNMSRKVIPVKSFTSKLGECNLGVYIPIFYVRLLVNIQENVDAWLETSGDLRRKRLPQTSAYIRKLGKTL